jgi:hypothetical protein
MMLALTPTRWHNLRFGMHAGATENEQKECLAKNGIRIVPSIVWACGRLLIGHGSWFDLDEYAGCQTGAASPLFSGR